MREEISWKEYFSLRLPDLKKKEYRHVLLLLYWPLELGFFTLSGRLPWTYHPIYSALDDQIPFLEGFVVPYELWFLCGAFLVLYTLRYDIPVFRRFMYFLIVTITLAGLVFIFYPNYFTGRPVPEWPVTIHDAYEAMPRQNAFTWMVSYIYHTDPPRNALPSEHIVVCFGMAFAVLQCRRLRRPAFSVPFLVLQLLICLSVVYVKQHSVLDILGALPVSAIGYFSCFFPWKKLRSREKAPVESLS